MEDLKNLTLNDYKSKPIESFQSVWYHTELPDSIIDLIVDDVKKYHSQTFDATIGYRVSEGDLDKTSRDSKVYFIPSVNWLVGFCYHYVLIANRENFFYDIDGFDHNQMQYTEYGPGQFYNWHRDDNRGATEEVRKLSFTLQLSDPDEYEGGEFQLISYADQLYKAPKKKGTLIVFDSLSKHRVTKVKSGVRKSLVGWVNGPRWK